MDACGHCGTAPEERHDTATKRTLVICLCCRARGEAALSRGRAWHTWRIVNDSELPLYRGLNSPRFRQKEGKWQWYIVGTFGGLMATLEGAIADYMRANRD